MDAMPNWRDKPGNNEALKAAVDKAGGHTCPFCKGKKWTIGNKLIAALELPTAPNNPARVFVHLSCANCYYVVLLDAAAMGVKP